MDRSEHVASALKFTLITVFICVTSPFTPRTTRLWHSSDSELHWVRLLHNKEFTHPEWIEVSMNPWPSRALGASGCFPNNNKKSSTINANHQKRSGKPFQTAASIVCGVYRPQGTPKVSPRPLTVERRTSAPKVITWYPDPPKIRVMLLTCLHVLCCHFAVAATFLMVLDALENRDSGLFNEPKYIPNGS